MNNRLRSKVHGALVAIFLIAASGMQAADDRLVTLGRGLICMCGGCQQLLGDCNHLGCSSAEPMRRELKNAVDSGMSDKAILASFAEKFGPKVLSAPSTTGWFNLSAWLMPFAVFAAGAIAVVYGLKRLRSTAPVGPSEPGSPSPYEREIEEELKKFTPED